MVGNKGFQHLTMINPYFIDKVGQQLKTLIMGLGKNQRVMACFGWGRFFKY
jgi:hypothetical protein